MEKINEKLENLTKDILIQHDMLKMPVDIVKILDDIGIEVYETDLTSEVSGAIKYDKDSNSFSILINKNNSHTRKRFTMAHELGHYFLHKDILQNDELHIDILYSDSTTELEEDDVNYFAGALLMNRMLLERLHKKISLSELAKLFDVSVSDMTVRLDILGLLD